jgi:hypothetical protein
MVADGFSDYFCKSFTCNNSVKMETSFSSLNVNSIHVTSITEKDVLRALKRLKSTVTSGPDLIPAFPIRDCANVFSTSLLILFNLIFKTCTFPSQWKISRICLVYKKGEKSKIVNYRPIAIINNFSVVIRRVVNVMPIIFVVVLRMSTALGYEFDECVSTSRIRKRR